MKIKDILNQYFTARNLPVREVREINLGYINGWGEAEKNFTAELNKLNRYDWRDCRRGRCITDYSFTVSDGEQTLIVNYTVDSGD